MNELAKQPSLWPPSYLVRKHLWARRIKFKASLKYGLEITVPRRFNLKELPSLLDKNREWIETQLLKLDQLKDLASHEALPEQLEFKAINQIWKINYVAAETRLQLLVRPQQELVVLGKIENKASCYKLLIQWSKKQARVELLKQLEEISLKIAIPYGQAKVRSQVSRWGSCSSKKSLSLNYKLLFLRPELMRHVMIHELCHTVHMNHSDRFWALVAEHDANWQVHRRELRRGQVDLPGWL